jgi:hypothetical protein
MPTTVPASSVAAANDPLGLAMTPAKPLACFSVSG